MTRPQDQHDPGGKVRLSLPDGIIGDAEFSACGRYRHSLSRDWTPQGRAPRSILWIGMNPSTADAEVSDPTCNRELTYSRDFGYTRYLKANMLDWRATSPSDLPKDPAQACSDRNLTAILEMASQSEQVLLAYGRLHGRYQPIVTSVLDALRQAGHPLFCLGLNADGSAKHPLYLKKSLTPVPFG